MRAAVRIQLQASHKAMFVPTAVPWLPCIRGRTQYRTQQLRPPWGSAACHMARPLRWPAGRADVDRSRPISRCRPGPGLIPVLLLWLPCIPLPAWPLALAEPNAEPTNFWPRTSAPWRRAGPRLASWAHADTGLARAQAEPPLAQQGSIGTPGRHTPRWGPPSPGKRRRHQSRQRYTGNPHLDICRSSSSSSRTRNTKMETPPRETDTHRFVSYRFRVCRHG